jgi:hypothetical protein
MPYYFYTNSYYFTYSLSMNTYYFPYNFIFQKKGRFTKPHAGNTKRVYYHIKRV